MNTYERLHRRKNIYDSVFPIFAEFYLNDELCFSGKIWDISTYGLCILIQNQNKEIDTDTSGIIKIWKIEKSIEIPVTYKWNKMSGKFNLIGLSSHINLHDTPLKNYMDKRAS